MSVHLPFSVFYLAAQVFRIQNIQPQRTQNNSIFLSLFIGIGVGIGIDVRKYSGVRMKILNSEYGQEIIDTDTDFDPDTDKIWTLMLPSFPLCPL